MCPRAPQGSSPVSQKSFVPAVDANCVVIKSDDLVSESLRADLYTAALTIENVQERFKNWRPGSYGMVLDLVHPSLFPLLCGHSLVLPYGKIRLTDCTAWSGQGITMSTPRKAELKGDFRDYGLPVQRVASDRFQ